MQESQKEKFICMAYINAAHGIKGNIKVTAFTEFAEDLKDFSNFYIARSESEINDKIIQLKILSVNEDKAICSSNLAQDRDAAETLKGYYLYIKRSDLPETEEDQFYHEDLLGLQVIDATDESIGTVINIVNYGSCDILEIEKSDGSTFMHPISTDFVESIDLEKNTIKILGN